MFYYVNHFTLYLGIYQLDGYVLQQYHFVEVACKEIKETAEWRGTEYMIEEIKVTLQLAGHVLLL